ncbi:hypothetical protein F989_02494 [Acinetobacter parvus NIPH 1103]|uniref:Transposase IS701-like DDE domain-containing protein n=1 Tax=Acinetobacter parvus NIPH 1103 TaxID=1217671 RepID=N8Q176_9GAMM|nr:hypothetical protein [Acinetobacter parvus]ENU32511.1 hypothetical protein F989_02494 [Acinetobacter parvus NIPH 1103]
MKKKAITRLDYCQYLLVSQTNYTPTNYAEHHPESISHDRINRYLRHDKLKPKLVWEKVKDDIVLDDDGYLIFDDSILDKNHSHKIELVNRQYSGNAHRIIKGICIVNCIYVNPKTEQYWRIDYRIYDKTTDGKSKLDHLKDMLQHSINHKKLDFKYVLMDTFPRSTVVRWNAKQVYIELKQEYEWQNSKKHKLNPIKIKHIKRRI